MVESLKHFALPHFRWTNITIGFDMNLFYLFIYLFSNLYFKFSIYLFIYFKCLPISNIFKDDNSLFIKLVMVGMVYVLTMERIQRNTFVFSILKLRRKCNDSAGNSCLSLWFNLLSQNLAVGKRLGKAGEKG